MPIVNDPQPPAITIVNEAEPGIVAGLGVFDPAIFDSVIFDTTEGFMPEAIGDADITDEPEPPLLSASGVFDSAVFDSAIFDTGGGFEREDEPPQVAITEE